MYHSFFIHSSINGHLGCFHVLAFVNSAAMNTGVQLSFRIVVFSGFMPNSGIAQSYGSFIPRLWGISILFSIVAVTIYIPTNSARGFPFLYILFSIYCLYFFFYDGHFDWYAMIAHHSFDLHFCNNEWCWAYFHVFIGHLYVFFGEMNEFSTMQILSQ